MRKNSKRPATSARPPALPPARPPVEAFQYEKLALSAFQFCDQQLNQFDTLINLATSIARHPTLTGDQRQHQHALMELLIDTAEQYRQDIEHDRHLYQVIALDAKGIVHSCITARHAANLLAEAANGANDTETAREV